MTGHSVQLWITTPSFAVNSSFQSFFVLYNRWLWHRSYLDCLSVQSQAKFHKTLVFDPSQAAKRIANIRFDRLL